MDGEKIVMCIGLGFVILLIFVVVPLAIIDGLYRYPQAAEKTNQICQERGYDFYERFERIGILSEEPVAIKCKYVDNYQEIDMKLRRISEEE